jgi:enoyl-[acyl-carrier protein] reductase II
MLMSPFAEEVAEAAARENIAVVTTGAGDPSPYMALWLESGVKVIPVVASVAFAKRVAKKGATAIIAEGGEAGGHIGDLTTMTLVPQVVDAVDIPVIAAGGIGDGRGVAAAFMLGAVGVQLGTRFLVAKECNIHQSYKDKVIKASDIGTIATGKRLGHPVRALKTPFSRNFFAKEYDSAVTNEELEALGAGALKRAVDGDEAEGCFMAGQIAGLVTREQTAAAMIAEIFAQANETMGQATKQFTCVSKESGGETYTGATGDAQHQATRPANEACEEAAPLTKGREAIKKILPHREPMLVVDEVELVDGVSVGKYTVRGSEFFLQGHFPGNPVVPGVILCEMMAQSSCLLVDWEGKDGKSVTPYFTSLNKVRFKHKVVPGDTVTFKCELISKKAPFYFVKAAGYVGDTLAVAGELSFAVVED